MGPPPFGSGNLELAGLKPLSGRGFNGATAFRQWKHRRYGVRPAGPGRASMGPPPFGSGNTGGTVFDRLDRGELQWGHRLSAVETPAVRCSTGWTGASFNGATAFRQWKPQRLKGTHKSSLCFNGATAFRHVYRGNRPDGLGLQWGHRLSAVETPAVRCSTGWTGASFNGATAFRQWKLLSERRQRVFHHGFNGATAFRQWKPQEHYDAAVHEM